MIKFPQGNKTYLKKAFIGRKVARTSTSFNDVSRMISSNYSDIFLKNIVPEEITHE